jgi:hypothetical protein
MNKCKVRGCPDKVHTKGLCGMHYSRQRQNLSLLLAQAPGRRKFPRKVTVRGSIVYIPLQNGLKAKTNALYLMRIWDRNWSYTRGKPQTKKGGEKISLVQFLFGKAKDGKIWMHKNWDKLDCRKENLKQVTPSFLQKIVQNRGV